MPFGLPPESAFTFTGIPILLRRGPKRPAVQLRLLLGAMPVMEEPLTEGSARLKASLPHRLSGDAGHHQGTRIRPRQPRTRILAFQNKQVGYLGAA